MSDHHDQDLEKDDKFNILVTEHERDDVETPAATTTAPFSFTNPSPTTQPMYPFEHRDIRSFDPEMLRPGVAPAFPRNGFFGLIGSVCTLFLTLIILFFVNGRHQWKGRVSITPASLISGILSLNGFFVSMAFAEGATIAWWFNARAPGTTLDQLHHNWSVGASKKDAVLAGRKLNYVALATLFVALVPLNGFVLQSALTTVPGSDSVHNAIVITPIVSELPLGFSAALNNDNTTGLASNGFSSVLETTFGNADIYTSPPSGSYFDVKDSKCTGECDTVVSGIGFHPVCTISTIPYDISDAAIPGTSAQVLDVSFAWSQRSPNVINMTSIWKNDTSCAGYLNVEHCTLQAAVMDYPIDMTIVDGRWPDTKQMQYFVVDPENVTMVRPIDVLFNEGATKNTTWGGFADALNIYFGASVNVTRAATGWNMQHAGLYAEQLAYEITAPTSDENDGSTTNIVSCSTAAADTPTWISLTEQTNVSIPHYIRNQIHQSMLYTGIALAFNDPHPPLAHTMTTARYAGEAVYQVRWRYYAASVVVTLVICMVIMPTFWGYWTLPHKATMSPVDTARAFYAPGLSEIDMKTPAKAILKEMGTRSPLDLAAGTGRAG